MYADEPSMIPSHYLVTVHLNIRLPLALLHLKLEDLQSGIDSADGSSLNDKSDTITV